MPKEHSWLVNAPAILAQLRGIRQASGPEELLGRKRIQEIFDLKRTGAQNLMVQAGAAESKEGFVIDVDLLVRYVEIVASPQAAAAEKARQRRMWGILDQARKDMKAKPVAVFRDKEQKIMRPVEDSRRDGLDGLPAGVEIGKGYVRVSFENAQECVLKLHELAQALMGDYERFEQRVKAG